MFFNINNYIFYLGEYNLFNAFEMLANEYSLFSVLNILSSFIKIPNKLSLMIIFETFFSLGN